MARRIGGRPYKQRGLWTGYPLDKSPPAAASTGGAPWYLWAAVSSAIAIASCAAPEYRTQPAQTLQPFRQTPVLSSGMGVMLGTQVVLLADEGIRQPDTSSHRLFFGRGAGTPPPQRLELHQPSKLPPEPDTDYRRGDHRLLHSYRTGYQTVGQPWFAMRPPVAVRVEVEGFDQHRTDYTPLYGRTTPVAPASPGAPWFLLKLQQVRPPDTDQVYEYRSRDFWSDLQPFRITPTTPVVEPEGGGGGFGYVKFKRYPKKVEEPPETEEAPEAQEPRQPAQEPAPQAPQPKPRQKPKPVPEPVYAAPDLSPLAAAFAEVKGLPQMLAAVAARKAQEAAQAEAERLALIQAADRLEALLLAEKRKREAALLLILHEAI